MSRLYGAFLVLAAVIVLSFSGYQLNTRTAGQLSTALQQAYHTAANGEHADSVQHMEEAAILLQNNRQQLCLFVSHRTVEEIEQAVAQANLCLRQQNDTLFFLYCKSAIDMTEDFIRLEQPHLYNII